MFPAEVHHGDVPSLLHFAARYGFRSVSGLLLQCPGAERALRMTNRHGQTPAEIAKSHGHTELHTMLKETLVPPSTLGSPFFHCVSLTFICCWIDLMTSAEKKKKSGTFRNAPASLSKKRLSIMSTTERIKRWQSELNRVMCIFTT